MDELPESELEKAAKSGDVDALRAVIAGIDFDGKSDEAADTLCVAAEHSRWDAVRYLVQEAKVDVSSDDSGGTVLQLAAVAGTLDLMKMLVAFGASLQSGRVGSRVLLSSAATGQLDILRYAIEQGADVKTYGDAAAWSAAKASCWEAVQILVSASADVATGAVGVQLLSLAAVEEQSGIVDLLEKRNVVIDSEAGVLALSTLASTQEWHQCASAVCYLVTKGVDTKGDAGTKALVTAAICGDLEMVRCLVESGVDVTSEAAGQAVARAGELVGPSSSSDIVAYLTGLGAVAPKPPDLVLDEDF